MKSGVFTRDLIGQITLSHPTLVVPQSINCHWFLAARFDMIDPTNLPETDSLVVKICGDVPIFSAQLGVSGQAWLHPVLSGPSLLSTHPQRYAKSACLPIRRSAARIIDRRLRGGDHG